VRFSSAIRAEVHETPTFSCRLLPSRRPLFAGFYTDMPNIRQQEKRVRQAAKQRAENLRWRSTSKTLMRRLKEAVDAGDTSAVSERHRELVSWLDKAASRGALHRNTAARRKAQAARVVAGDTAE
jgi:small subunit ribosomal protein S20